MRTSRSRTILPYAIILLILVALGAVTWGNYNYASQNPGGNDFLVHWVGTRALIEDGISPYSDEVAVRIQTAAYGRPAREGEHELRVAYPLYSVLLFIPFALIKDFTMARAVWMTALETGLLGMTMLSLRLYRWRPRPILLGLLLVFSLFWYNGLRSLINGNAVILVALMLVAGMWAMRYGADELAGILFGFATIKPQVVVIFLLFIVIWSFMQRRWRVIGWLIGTVFLLTAGAALIIPDWILQNLREVMRYPGYNPPGTPSAVFISLWPNFGERLGWAMTVLMGLVLLLEWWRSRNTEFRGFLWAAAITLTASQWIGIQTDPGNFIVLFPGLILAFAVLDERWYGRGLLPITILLLGLFVGLWVFFLNTVTYADQPIQSPLMFFPLPALMFILLYWVRWWAVRPPRPWLEQINL
ncbi:MAG: DUF2029 domain-containing protein [Anaerolineae bacterium]|nr:DUF2029 domain-containing protein [Anaerolineae bacterium]